MRKWPTSKPGPWLGKVWTRFGDRFMVFLIADAELSQLDRDELWELSQTCDAVMFAGFGYTCHDCRERHLEGPSRTHTYHDIPLPDGRVERRHRYVCPACADKLRQRYGRKNAAPNSKAALSEVREVLDALE